MLREIATDPAAELRCIVLIESIGDFLQTPADAALVDMVRQFKREEHFVIAEAESSAWVSSWPLSGESRPRVADCSCSPTDRRRRDLKTSRTRAKRRTSPRAAA